MCLKMTKFMWVRSLGGAYRALLTLSQTAAEVSAGALVSPKAHLGTSLLLTSVSSCWGDPVITCC